MNGARLGDVEGERHKPRVVHSRGAIGVVKRPAWLTLAQGVHCMHAHDVRSLKVLQFPVTMDLLQGAAMAASQLQSGQTEQANMKETSIPATAL